MGLTVLVVDDEVAIRESIEYALRKDGYQVETAEDGWQALDRFRSTNPDLVILDVMMPEMSGFEVCRAIRAESQVPIIFLTVRSTEFDKVTGLDLGADDYVTKPFSPRELAARVRTRLRRDTGPLRGSTPASGDLVVDADRRIAAVRGVPLILTLREFELLQALSEQPGFAFSRDALLEKIWGSHFEGESRTVDMHISRVREKLKQAGSNVQIETLRGFGYRLQA